MLLAGALALVALAASGVGAALGVVDAHGVAGVVPGVAQGEGAGGVVVDAGGEGVAGDVTVYGVSGVVDVEGAAGGSGVGLCVPAVRGLDFGVGRLCSRVALAGPVGSDREGAP